MAEQPAAHPAPARAVYVEAPPGWGPGRMLITRLERLGYRVRDQRSPGTGERRLLLS